MYHCDFQVTVIAFSEGRVKYCRGYDGCYHNKTTQPTGLALLQMERFIRNLNTVKGETSYMTGINEAYEVFGKQKHNEEPGSHHHHSKSANNLLLCCKKI